MQSNSYVQDEYQPNYTPTSDEKTLAILSHVLTLVAPILAPLIIYLVKKDESKYVAYHAKESLNFQITLMIAIIGLLITVIGILFIWIIAIAAFVLVIVATIRASEGTLYKYPFTLRLIK
ncbi:DUF4870 domain-containing protein [Segetibacter aerophilus]|uniref:Membrane protein n=1 Tax=Segetibacter aerophilus TaxID=670293 RepID=A0A512BBR6_9BACT|nr:DUF4870 domain-containing protein [Segetibacter aerophilus]GEO09421.1 membrane protein [Segetibacter aerophilus]